MENVCIIADLLAKSEQHARCGTHDVADRVPDGMKKVVCIGEAKIPIVKIWDPELELACDMNVNNPLALENTRMVKTYVQIDPRVRPLAMIIKHWTKARVVNDAGKRTPHARCCHSLTTFQLLVARSVRTRGFA